MLGLVVPIEKLVNLEEYFNNLYNIAIDKPRFERIKGYVIGKDFLEALEFDLIIKHEIKHLFLNKPTFERYTEVDEVFIKVVNLEIPS